MNEGVSSFTPASREHMGQEKVFDKWGELKGWPYPHPFSTRPRDAGILLKLGKEKSKHPMTND